MPDHVTRDLCDKAIVDVSNALQRTMNLCDHPTMAASVGVSVLVRVAEIAATMCQFAVDCYDNGAKKSRDITRAELLAWMLTAIRMANSEAIGIDLPYGDALNLSQRDVSLLLASGFPASGMVHCGCEVCVAKREAAAHG